MRYGRPQGLIRYASENGIAEGKKLRYTGRMKFYTVLLMLLIRYYSLYYSSAEKILMAPLSERQGIYTRKEALIVLSNLYQHQSDQ